MHSSSQLVAPIQHRKNDGCASPAQSFRQIFPFLLQCLEPHNIWIPIKRDITLQRFCKNEAHMKHNRDVKRSLHFFDPFPMDFSRVRFSEGRRAHLSYVVGYRSNDVCIKNLRIQDCLRSIQVRVPSTELGGPIVWFRQHLPFVDGFLQRFSQSIFYYRLKSLILLNTHTAQS